MDCDHIHEAAVRRWGPAQLEQAARRWVWNQTQDEQLQDVQRDWESALERVLDDWRGISQTQRRALTDRIRELAARGDVEGLAYMADVVDTGPGADALRQAMEDLAQRAGERIADEAASQGVSVTPRTGDLGALKGYAAATAALLGQGLALSAGREALRVHHAGAEVATTVSRVQAHLEGLSEATVRDLTGGALSNAQNRARIATLRGALEDSDNPIPAYYANETLDGNTCGPCAAVDGRWLGVDLDQVERIYPNGGYTDCQGRERCRGTVVAVFRPETTGQPTP
jgi:hypothetical protein